MAAQDEIISPEIAWKLIRDEGATVIDCRTADECREGTVAEALEIPHTEIEQHLEELKPFQRKPVVVYCAVGGRAALVKQALERAGFTKVFNAGGYEDLKSGTL